MVRTYGLLHFDKKGQTLGACGTTLGPEINTAGDDMFPYIHENGDLYFASNGHISLGGLDIFHSQMTGEDVEDLEMGCA